MQGYKLVEKKLFQSHKRISQNQNSRAITSRYTHLITQAAEAESLDIALLHAVIHTESAFNSDALSSRGAQGLMQLMPKTAKALGVTDAFNEEENIMAGSRLLASLIHQFGDINLALAAYNAGTAAVVKYQGIPPFRETQNYVQRVRALEQIYRREFDKQQ